MCIRDRPIGHIGYYYPAEVWISEYGKLYAKYEYQDEIECFPDVFALIERELRQCKFDSAAMKTVEALDVYKRQGDPGGTLGEGAEIALYREI